MGFWTDLGSVATGAIERDREKTKATLDDRKDELKLLKMVETKTGRKAVIYEDSSLKDGEKTKHFAVLMPMVRNA